ncbi:putative ribonuclease [Sphingobium herbicidovorans NBRC 16415]|uniref:Ribonuclease n=1 Tax=Sphingobium herbicidovorans (strain ATCC 700291 / DSM 11019 / CCUG 56400 / KCTC 2939 / LMG 18315 / NBRC 16415 / MH) TaxID=1219045 RepID=A0A086P7M4_SPHHM|nr:YihY/virulence factor BrkB family protein [Sphingobium herbicidovorans]KFG89392.1 putative ribonuclease [Sphingobium herbicidovorans NBRC 16415]
MAAQDTDRGRSAQRPQDMPKAAWRDILLRTWNESSADNVGLVSAGVAFYGFLAFVPTLAALVLCYGLLADPSTIADHLRSLFQLLPEEAARLIGEQLLSVINTSADKKGFGLLVSLALSIYGAMNGASAIVKAVNIAYDEEESRSFFKLTALACLITIGLLVTAVIAIFAIAALAFLEQLMPGAPGIVTTAIRVGFWLLAAFAASMIVSMIYRYAPDRHRAQWRWLTPGSVLATVGWLAVSLGFGVYASQFGNYGATYGALSAVVVTLMWLYLSAYILVLGAELNSEIEHQTAEDTTIGRPKPMGERRAYVADTIGTVP